MAKETDKLNILIASNLRDIRRKRGITLDDMAEMTGVSKSMLGQIERGESGLSVSTLWKISNGMKVSFAALMNESCSAATVVDNKHNPALPCEDEGFKLYPLFPGDTSRMFDVFYLEIEPGSESVSAAHKDGTQEFTMVVDGSLTLKTGDSVSIVKAGQSTTYAADQPHEYRNDGEITARMFNIVYYKD